MIKITADKKITSILKMRFPGQNQVVFLVKGPIYLVCISCTDETYEYLRGQLDLLYGQVITHRCSVSFLLNLDILSERFK